MWEVGKQWCDACFTLFLYVFVCLSEWLFMCFVFPSHLFPPFSATSNQLLPCPR